MTYQKVSESKTHSNVAMDAKINFRDGKVGEFRPSKPEGVSRPQGTKIPPPVKKSA
jgi:hypothetical protein